MVCYVTGSDGTRFMRGMAAGTEGARLVLGRGNVRTRVKLGQRWCWLCCEGGEE